MSDSAVLNNPVKSGGSAFLWGAAAIGAEINRTERQTVHLLSTGKIKCAKKIGGFWVASRDKLRQEFGG
jgi:hypothetical protein